MSQASSRRGSTASSATPPPAERPQTASTRTRRGRRTKSMSPRQSISERKNRREDEKKGKKSETVKVVCRFRPENKTERETGGKYILSLREGSDQQLTIEDDKGNERAFAYDKIFPPYSTQEEVYKFSAMPIVESVVNGYNGAIIAYGQTGSGKTHTMVGPPYEKGTPEYKELQLNPKLGLVEGAGVLPRVLYDLFQFIRAAESSTCQIVVSVSYLEIYRELIKDLLAPDSVKEHESLVVRTDETRGIHLPQATEVPITNITEGMQVLRRGTENRRTAETRGNERSSRSHSVFLISLYRSEGGSLKASQLYCVDLAGSEKISKTELLERPPNMSPAQFAELKNLRKKEGQKINQALLALSNVCFALATKSRNKTVHVPYRNSKLTRILQNAIGGNSKTVMIICCSPSSYNCQETLSTLRFGKRASMIKNEAVVNKQYSVKQLRRLLDDMEQENRRLKARLTQMESLATISTTIQEVGGYDQKVYDKKAIAPRSLQFSQEGDIRQAAREITSAGIKRPGIRELLFSFICPLSKFVMIDPVIAMDGYTYDRRAIESHLKTGKNSPMTGKKLTHMLIPNLNLLEQIKRYYPDYKRKKTLSYFSVISVQAILNIFSFLNPTNLACCSRVCHEWESVSSDQKMWLKHIARQYLELNPKVKDSVRGAKKYFCRKMMIQYNADKKYRRKRLEDRMGKGVHLHKNKGI